MSNFKTETFEFSEIPSTLDELKSLPEAKLETPFMTAALTVLALCRYEKDVNSAIEMINFLKGPVDLTEYDKQFLRDRLKGNRNTCKLFRLSYFLQDEDDKARGNEHVLKHHKGMLRDRHQSKMSS